MIYGWLTCRRESGLKLHVVLLIYPWYCIVVGVGGGEWWPLRHLRSLGIIGVINVAEGALVDKRFRVQPVDKARCCKRYRFSLVRILAVVEEGGVRQTFELWWRYSLNYTL